MKVIIVGGDRFVEEFAEILIKEKNDVVIIENNDKRAEELATKLDALVLHGDGTSKEILEDADIKHVDAVVAMSGDDKVNLMVCELAKSYNVPNIIARVNQASNQNIFIELGISKLINTTISVVSLFKKALEKSGTNFLNFTAGDKAEIFEINITDKSDFLDKSVKDVQKGFIICCIYRKGEFLLPKPNVVIKQGDVLTVCAPVEKVKDIEKALQIS
jgi:trk system potassium uptake protein TrkA